jgi:hypothetical protein
VYRACSRRLRDRVRPPLFAGGRTSNGSAAPDGTHRAPGGHLWSATQGADGNVVLRGVSRSRAAQGEVRKFGLEGVPQSSAVPLALGRRRTP